MLIIFLFLFMDSDLNKITLKLKKHIETNQNKLTILTSNYVRIVSNKLWRPLNWKIIRKDILKLNSINITNYGELLYLETSLLNFESLGGNLIIIYGVSWMLWSHFKSNKNEFYNQVIPNNWIYPRVSFYKIYKFVKMKVEIKR